MKKSPPGSWKLLPPSHCQRSEVTIARRLVAVCGFAKVKSPPLLGSMGVGVCFRKMFVNVLTPRKKSDETDMLTRLFFNQNGLKHHLACHLALRFVLFFFLAVFFSDPWFEISWLLQLLQVARWILQHFCSDWSEKEAIEPPTTGEEEIDIGWPRWTGNEGMNPSPIYQCKGWGTLIPYFSGQLAAYVDAPPARLPGKVEVRKDPTKCVIFLVVVLLLVLGGDHPESYKADYIIIFALTCLNIYWQLAVFVKMKWV